MNYGDWVFGRGRGRPWANDWQSALLPLDPNRDQSATPIVGGRLVRHGARQNYWFGDPPAAAGRECALCPTILSRWNEGAICGACERAARSIYPPLVLDLPSVVYYARSDALIKIGTSIDVKTRMRVLGVNLLATEPGSFQEEAARHRQFAHLNERGEWFRPGADLLDHIDGLTGAHEAAA